VILGHLVPAGTGFHTYQQSEVRIRPQALAGLAAEKEDVLARHFPLLDTPRKAEKPAAAPHAEPHVLAAIAAGNGSAADADIHMAVPSLDALFLDEDAAEEEE
jgi:DNA-directed RNA polymerase subunit beta'